MINIVDYDGDNMLLNQDISLKEISEKVDIKNFIYMEGKLPYSLNISTDLYIFTMNIDLNSIYDESFRKRQVCFFTSQKWIDGQKVPSLKSVLKYNILTGEYTNIINTFKIVVEIFDEELSELKINNYDNERERKLFQAVLSYISEKYNQAKMGNDYISISIEDGGSTPISLYTKSQDGYKNESIAIFPALSLQKFTKHMELDFKSILQQNDIVWLYYYNLAIYSYNKQDYLNTIIYSSISIEAYLNYLISINNMLKDFNLYNKGLIINKQVPGFFTTINFLLDKNLITEDLSKNIKKCCGILRDKRNDIIHGKINSIIINGTDSIKGLEELSNIYIQNESSFVKQSTNII